MEKIQKLTPPKVPMQGRKVFVSEDIFAQIINTINLQTETINVLIAHVEATDGILETVQTNTQTLQDSVKKLAHALQIYSED